MNLLLLGLFVAIQLVDMWTTWRGISSGRAGEALPLGRALIPILGLWPTMLLLKAVFVAAALLITLYVSNAYWFTGILCLFGAWVLWRNWRFVNAA